MSFIERVERIQREVCDTWSARLTAALNESYEHEGVYMRHGSRLSTIEDEEGSEGQGEEETLSSELSTSLVVSGVQAVERSEEGESRVEVVVDWGSFTSAFSNVLSEFGQERLEQVMDSVAGSSCMLLLLDKLIQLCKPTTNRHIRSYLRTHLRKYIIRYSDDPRQWGTFENGELVDIVELELGEDGRSTSWLFRDVSQTLESTPHLQQYLVDNYYLPRWQTAIRHLLGTPIRLVVDWEHIALCAKDFAKAVMCVYYDKSAYVLEELYRAFEAVATYDEDDLVDAVACNLAMVEIGTIKGADADRRDFEVFEETRKLRLNLVLEADKYSGVFRWRELVPILKLAGLWRNKFTAAYKMELLSAAARLYKVPNGDLSMFTQVLGWGGLWWKPSEAETEGFQVCLRQIEGYYREVLRSWHDSSHASPYDEEEYSDDLKDRTEKYVKAWHVIKFNKRNFAQERVLFLTDKAYWTFKFHFEKKKFDEGHFKRHDLIDFFLVEVGPYLITDAEEVKALKVYTQETRSKSLLGKPKEVEVTPDSRRKKIDRTTRKSMNMARYKIFSTSVSPSMFAAFDDMDQEMRIEVRRNKKTRPERARPSTSGMYNSVFMPDGALTDPHSRNFMLQEIAWCLYAVACARQRSPGHEPFLDVRTMTRPRGSIYSSIYNWLGAGFTTKNVEKEAQEKAEALQLEEYDPEQYRPQFMFSGTGVLKNPSTPTGEKRERHVHFSPQLAIFYHEEQAPPVQSLGKEISFATSAGEEDYGISGDEGFVITDPSEMDDVRTS